MKMEKENFSGRKLWAYQVVEIKITLHLELFTYGLAKDVKRWMDKNQKVF